MHAGDPKRRTVATLGVQFAQSLATCLALASVTLVAGWVVVRALVAWATESAGNGRVGRVLLGPVVAVVRKCESAVRPLAGVSARAPSRAPPTTFGAVWRRQPPYRALRRAE